MSFPQYIPEELSLFTERPLLLSIQDSVIHDYHPLNTLEGATNIEFMSLGYTDKFKDLSHIFLKLKLQVLKKDGTMFKATDLKPHLVSNALYSIFKSAYCRLNGNNLRNVEGNYHYKEYLETSLNFDKLCATSRLTSQLYVPNAEQAKLELVSKNSNIFDLYGKINLININKYLLSGVSFSLRLNLENPDFFFMEDTGTTGTNTTSILKIKEATLYVKHILPREAVLLSIEKVLSSGRNCIYEYRRGEIVTQNIASSSSTLNIPNFYTGPKPSILVFMMCENKAFAGDRTKNPFEFKYFDLSTFNFVVNGQVRPKSGYQMTIIDSEQSFNHIFSKVYESLGYHQSDKSTLINSTNFKTTHFVIVEDICALSGLGLSKINELDEIVTIGVSGTFSKALTSTVTCILYMLIPSRFEVNAQRQVILVK